MLSGDMNLATYLIDEILYFEGFTCFFVAYFLLLAFWAAVLHKRGADRGWFTTKMRRLVYGFVITTVTILTSIPFVDTFGPGSISNIWPSVVNTVVVIYLLVLSVGSIIKSVQILRLVKSFENKEKRLVGVITRITAGASVSMVIT